jgi:hypothetical protein
MTPELRNCVVVGRFNPAILSPAWIVANQVLPEGRAEGSSLVGTNVIKYTLNGLTWQPSLTKLEVTADHPDANPGEFVARVLTLLPHTPITAVGSNFLFQVAAEDGARIFSLVKSQVQEVTADAEHEMLDYSVSFALKYGSDCVININIDTEKETVYNVGVNFNRLVTSATVASEHALKWASDEAEALRLFHKILGS